MCVPIIWNTWNIFWSSAGHSFHSNLELYGCNGRCWKGINIHRVMILHHHSQDMWPSHRLSLSNPSSSSVASGPTTSVHTQTSSTASPQCRALPRALAPTTKGEGVRLLNPWRAVNKRLGNKSVEGPWVKQATKSTIIQKNMWQAVDILTILWQTQTFRKKKKHTFNAAPKTPVRHCKTLWAPIQLAPLVSGEALCKQPNYEQLEEIKERGGM